MSVFNVKFLPSKQLFAARSAEPTGRAGGRAGAGFGSDPSVSFPPKRYRPPCFSTIKHGFIILIGMGGGGGYFGHSGLHGEYVGADQVSGMMGRNRI